MDEQEKFALLANVPYLLHNGVTPDIIEEELREFGIDHTIDPELSDEDSAVLVSDDEVVHSIRGTADFRDILNDIKLGSGISALFTTIASKPYLQPSLRKEAEQIPFLNLLKYVPETTPIMNYIKTNAASAYRQAIPKTLNPEIRSMSKMKTGVQMLKTIPALPIVVGTVAEGARQSIQKALNVLFPEDLDRYTSETDKHAKLMNKYADKQVSLTGHSLGGSIANHLGRIYNLPSITFNAAPSHHSDSTPHPASTVYRTKFDIVSYLRDTNEENELVKLVNQKVIRPHTLLNFLPTQKKESSKSHTIHRFELNKLEREEIEYCRRFPQLPFCKQFN